MKNELSNFLTQTLSDTLGTVIFAVSRGRRSYIYN